MLNVERWQAGLLRGWDEREADKDENIGNPEYEDVLNGGRKYCVVRWDVAQEFEGKLSNS